MKKIIILLFAIVTIFAICTSLVGCNKNEQTVEKESVISISDLIIDNKNVELDVGENYQLQCIIIPENATNNKLLWKSGNTEIATINENEEILAVAPGTTTII